MKKLELHQKFRGGLVIFLIIAVLTQAGTAWAVGPVDVGSVPGGANVTDDDGGSGEQWGRADGRTILYEDFVTGNFTDLSWRPLAAGIAFDNEITGATDEELNGPSLVAADTLEWTGQTSITNDITNSVVTVYTRFTVVASENFSSPPYSIDILAAGGDFSINVLFEASLNSGGPYTPALDFFDNYPTPPGHDGYAKTSFDHGFFFEEFVGMTIEEHDSNMQGRFNDVDGALDFLTIETINRLADIALKVYDNNDGIMWIKSDLAALATRNDIDSLRDRLSETDALILCLWIGNALFPACPPDAPPGLPNLIGLVAGQADLMEKLLWAKEDLEALAALVAQNGGSQAIEVTAIKSNTASSRNDTVMVLTSLNGLPTDADITSVTAVTESKKNGIGAESLSFAATSVATGLQGLEIELPGSLGSIKTLMITVEHSDGGGGTLHGSTLISDWN